MAGAMGRFRGWLGSHLKFVVLSAIGGLAVSAALAIATVPDGGGVIHTCYEFSAASGLPKDSGPNWRVIDSASQSCDPATEVPLNFNQQGPVGPAGAAGVPAVQDASDQCRAAVGRMTLTGKSKLSSDLCAARKVRVAVQSSTGQGKGGTATTEYELTKLQDGISQKLFLATSQGAVFKVATIEIYTPGTSTVARTLKLSNASISSFKVDLGLTRPTETLTLVAANKKGV